MHSCVRSIHRPFIPCPRKVVTYFRDGIGTLFGSNGVLGIPFADLIHRYGLFGRDTGHVGKIHISFLVPVSSVHDDDFLRLFFFCIQYGTFAIE